MKTDDNKKTLHFDCIELANSTPTVDRGFIEWSVPATPAKAADQPKTIKVVHIKPIAKVKTKAVLEITFEAAQIAFLMGVIAIIIFGIIKLIIFLSNPAVLKTILSVIAFLLILFMLFVSFTARRPGRHYTDTSATDFSWNVKPRHRTTGQNNTTLINVIGDNATVSTNISNNQNRT